LLGWGRSYGSVLGDICRASSRWRRDSVMNFASTMEIYIYIYSSRRESNVELYRIYMISLSSLLYSHITFPYLLRAMPGGCRQLTAVKSTVEIDVLPEPCRRVSYFPQSGRVWLLDLSGHIPYF